MILSSPARAESLKAPLGTPPGRSPPQSPPSRPSSPSRPSMSDAHFAQSSSNTPISGRSPQSSVPSHASEKPPGGGALGSTLSGGGVSPSSGGAAVAMPVPAPSQSTASVHPLLGYVPHGNKILSRNLNGTPAFTSQPSNDSELQLYRVLQRANLLNYYDTFIGQGGDDVQQLCEAGEEEFLEIMALVGMAAKPLHVRRLQKALQEWVSNPPLFQIPLLPNLPPSVVAGFPPFGNTTSSTRAIMPGQPTPTTPTRPSPPVSASSTQNNHNSSPGLKEGVGTNNNSLTACSGARGENAPSAGPQGRGSSDGVGAGGSSPGMQPSHPITTAPPIPPSTTTPLQNCQAIMSSDKSPELLLQFMKNASDQQQLHGCSPPYPAACTSPTLQLNPSLHESQIARLAQSAYEMVANLPPFEPKKDPINNKRKVSKELEFPSLQYIMNMSEDDPRRMEEIRKYAAIYGRFDCKRKPEKPLTLHEVSVNEAAAQICKYMPALLTRRDELFPLARQVVRDSGYQYSKGHSRSQAVILRDDEPMAKRSRSDSGQDGYEAKNSELHWKKKQERLESISNEMRSMSERAEEIRQALTSGTGSIADLVGQMDSLQARHAQLTLEQNELLRPLRKPSKSDRVSVCSEDRDKGDDSDSQFSFSGASSPSQLVQDTLVDEGLRVVKESLSQSKDSSRNPLDCTMSRLHQLEANGPSKAGSTSPNSTQGGRLVSPPTSYSEIFPFSENKVISASQGNIIAVANPALSMSSLSEEERHISALYTQTHAQRQNSTIKQEPGSPNGLKQD